MISTITFETAALSDAIKKAAKVAPTKGAAFDKASGIVLQFDPSSPVPLAILRATNLEVSSMEWVNVASMDGEPATWRLPSGLLSLIVASLPIGTGKQVTFTAEASGHHQIVNLKSGRTKCKFHPIDMTYYPLWGAFDPDNMYPATDLGGRLDQVEWAASRSDVAKSGVYLDGSYAVATDGFRMARVPLSIPDLPEPIIVPSGILGSILRQTGDVQIGSDGHMLHVMPDDTTQIKAVLMDVDYPPVQRIMDRPFDSEVEVSRDALLEVMNRVNVIGQADRVAAFRLFVGREEIALYMKNEEVGEIGDVVDIPGYATHERFEMRFTPKNIMEPLSKSPNDKIKISYNMGANKSLVKIDDGAGYEAWVAPRANIEKGSEG